ncbi:tetratricopeptide repeat protein [Actinoplanes sp. NPDC051411]|uniref:serine/threonine-protein kinase n=1 Tax=Actinoplanes sp. NPDC051411 TaxID=3155522 RepID=UPI003433C8E2
MSEKCNRPGCDGTVDSTGFCQICFRRPLPPGTTPPVPRARPTGGPVGGGVPGSVPSTPARTAWLVPELVSVPVPEPPDPSEHVLADPQVPEPSRVCANCHSTVGRSYAGRPAVLEGTCPYCETPFSFVPKLRAGQLVADQYEVVGCVARGGLGWVYLAKDTHLDDNYVALKGLITNDEVALRLAVAERRFLTSIDHPNIVRIFNSVTHRDPETGGETGYIVMEFLTGQSLQEIRAAAVLGDAPLPLEHVLAFGHEILAALEYLHDRGMLYCDMKPANVIRCPDRVKVIDIGGVRRIDDTDSPRVVTPGYIGKTEVEQRGLTVRSDIHTVGRTLEEMLAVSQPADAGDPAAADVGFAVESIRKLINRAIAPYDDRFATAAEMNRQLKGVLRELLSLRTGRGHPEPSQVFAPTPVLLDDGLGAIPGLRLWTRRPAGPLDIGRPTPSTVVVSLPEPLLDPSDPGIDLLATVNANNPQDLIDKLSAVEADSVEIQFALCRAHLAVAARERPPSPVTYERAARHLDAAVAALEDRAPHDWRVDWHQGLSALARDDVPAAREAFGAVSGACPGEIAPKLALGYCAEQLKNPDDAGRYYRAIWRRDRSEGGAAFGLARIALVNGDRATAVAILDEIPRVSRHYEPARIAAVRILSGRLPDSSPSAADLAEAARRLAELRLDGGAATGESRERLTAIVAAAELEHACEHDHKGPSGSSEAGLSEAELRARLERSLRALAAQARTRDDHGILVDLANGARSRSLW